ncbi:hypothetical protein HKD37_14G040026 [Glycine soja]
MLRSFELVSGLKINFAKSRFGAIGATEQCILDAATVPKKVVDRLVGLQRDLGKFNFALLGKWRWNLFHHHGELGAQVLESKYRSWRNLDATRRSIKESLWWRVLSFVWNLSEEGSWLKESNVG